MAATSRTLAAICAVSTLAIAPPAFADGGASPSTAPNVSVGTTNFGDTGTPDDDYHDDFWRLPAILVGDQVQVAIDITGGDQFVSLCLTGNADDYDFHDKACNFSGDKLIQDVDRVRLNSKSASTNVLLGVYDYYLESATYNFVVEAIRHFTDVTIPPRSHVSRTGSITTTPHLTDGTTLPEGTGFTLRISYDDQVVNSSAKVNAKGKLSFDLKLPRAAIGSTATFQVRKAATTTLRRVRSHAQKIKITS